MRTVVRPTALLIAVAASLLPGCANDFGAQAVNSAPLVRIDAPADEAVFEAFQTVDFTGVVHDANGIDDLDTVVWRSDVDGDLGQPEQVFPDPEGYTYLSTQLSTGAHTVTLEATDLSGRLATDSITVIIGQAYTQPSAEILAPDDFDEFSIGDDIDFVGAVSDPNQDPETLFIEWTWVNTSGGTPTVLYSGAAAANGTSAVDWEDVPAGNFEVALSVLDDEGNEATDEVFVTVIDPYDIDDDGDGFSENDGDCNDNDDTVYPGAPELCDSKDNDCNLIVDDKDADLDGHVDEACTDYDGTALPVDDCDDGDHTVYPGAPDDPEAEDGVDNDCDGYIDENTDSFDDDGDCFCEGPSCVDGIDGSCVLQPGDCADDDDSTHPDAQDLPDPAFWDDNCDGIDGDKALAVFVSPAGTNNSRCDFASPCETIGHAINRAGARGLDQVYLRSGTYEEVVVPTSGLSIWGGWDTSWVRDDASVAAHRATLAGSVSGGQYMSVRLVGVSGVLIADLRVKGPDASGYHGSRGKSSYGVYARSAQATLENLSIVGGKGQKGFRGSSGSSWSQWDRADAGDSGDPARELSWFGECYDGRQDGGSGGYEDCANGAGSTRGGTGGEGGQADTLCNWCGCTDWLCGGNCNDTAGIRGYAAPVNSWPLGFGGAGGAKCTGTPPGGGRDGRVYNGQGGSAGDNDGELISNYWYSGSGGKGQLGLNGGGGGGGGGSGGCDNGSLGSDAVGAGGGGGGAGGCRNENPGFGGGGGGGSFGVFAMAFSTLDVYDCDFTLGEGGDGGDGGTGGAGQPGGWGGSGGSSASGTGAQAAADGGRGGHGGHAGGGGGGAGGSVYGIYTQASTVNDGGNSNSFSGVNPSRAGNGGDGGDSGPNYGDGNPGRDGPDGVVHEVGSCSQPTGC